MLMLTMIVLLVGLPVIIGYTVFWFTRPAEGEVCEPEVRARKVNVGDRIIYTKTKFSSLPGARAHHITASNKGEHYTYLVDKYWVVAEVLDDGRVVARTRRGKLNYVWPDDPNLRKAGLIRSLIHRDLFPALAEAA
ncbi:MAG TPA: hypothetical protein VG733_00905 [Chthoniobacteraceae bacterium]|nr:hypothetical protein [Chthoniobacteraceae bacterium]